MKPDRLGREDSVATTNRRTLFIRDALPSEWLLYSQELADVAEVIWRGGEQTRVLTTLQGPAGSSTVEGCSHSHARTYILLAGLALENVLKGLLIAGNRQLISSGTSR